MPTTAQMEAYILALGIAKIDNEKTNYDDEFTTLMYQMLTGGRDNILTDDSGDVITDDDGNVLYE